MLFQACDSPYISVYKNPFADLVTFTAKILNGIFCAVSKIRISPEPLVQL